MAAVAGNREIELLNPAPTLNIELDGIATNVQNCLEACRKAKVRCTAVVKSAYAREEIVKTFRDAGINDFWIASEYARSSVSWKKTDNVGFIGLTDPASACQIVNCVNTSLHTSLETITAVSKAAESLNQKHGVFLSVDVGDLRDGWTPDDIEEIAAQVEDPLTLCGLMMNFGCCEMAMPSDNFFDWLTKYSADLNSVMGFEIQVSIGGSVVLDWVSERSIPNCVSEIRLGEALILGRNPNPTAANSKVGVDAIYLSSTVVHVSKKSPNKGCILPFYRRQSPENRNHLQERVIINVGTVHTDPNGILTDANGRKVDIISYCGEYTVIGTEPGLYKVGDQVNFRLSYIAMARSFSSNLVEEMYHSLGS